MVNEHDVYRPPMSNYQPYYSQYPYHAGFDNQMFYYHPNMYGNYYPPPYMNGMMNPASVNYANSTQTEAEKIVSSRVMQQFLDENGQVDIQKMLQTVGQLADTVQQVSPVIRQLNDLIRTFRA